MNYKKLNWSFTQDITSWAVDYKDNQGHQSLGFYCVFRFLTLALLAWGSIDFAYEVIYLWWICGQPVYPDQPTLMKVFAAMQAGYVYLCFKMFFHKKLTAIGLFAAIISISFLVAHHVSDITTPTSYWVKTEYSWIDWFYFAHSYEVIKYGISSLGNNNRRRALIVVIATFLGWLVYFLHLEIVVTFCLDHLDIPFCMNLIRGAING